MARRSELSECELATMKCIWDAEENATCSEIRDRLESQYGMVYKDTTVYTFLKNLQKKGFVDCKQRGVKFYFATRDEESFRAAQLKHMESFWFEGNTSKLITALFKNKKMTKEEKEEVKKAIDKLGL